MSVYITASGHFLPGPAISNDEMEPLLGYVHGKPSRLKRRILQSNGIHTRHYAIDAKHNTLFSNADDTTLADHRARCAALSGNMRDLTSIKAAFTASAPADADGGFDACAIVAGVGRCRSQSL